MSVERKVMTRHLFLIGFMGSGKSYLGEQLAKRLRCPFFDLDRIIEEGEGNTVANIFAASGEAGFRLLERAYLHKLAYQTPAVVATGGGTPCFFDNMDWMNAQGVTVYLETPLALLLERLRGQRAARPLLAGLDDAKLSDHIESLLAKRTIYYKQAKTTMKGETSDDFWRVLIEAVE